MFLPQYGSRNGGAITNLKIWISDFRKPGNTVSISVHLVSGRRKA